MKVLKKDLREFVDSVERKAINSVKAKYNKTIEQSKLYRTEEQFEKINKIKDIMIKAQSEMQELLDSGLFNAWGKLYYANKDCRDSIGCLKRIDYLDITDNELEENLIEEKKKKVQEVENEYAKVKGFIGANTPIKGYNYLKELGFDVSSIPVYENGQISTALVTQIDTSKLFVGMEGQ